MYSVFATIRVIMSKYYRAKLGKWYHHHPGYRTPILHMHIGERDIRRSILNIGR